MISIVDDDESVRDSTRQLLRSAGYQVATFNSAESFLDAAAADKSDCLILDVRMPGMDGLELQRRLNAAGADVPIVIVTAHDDANSRRQAIKSGAVEFLSKPFETKTLLSTVQTAMQRYPMTEEQRQYVDQDLASMIENLGNIATLLRACYGDMDMRVIRAEEASGAVQRVIWEIERRASADGRRT